MSSISWEWLTSPVENPILDTIGAHRLAAARLTQRRVRRREALPLRAGTADCRAAQNLAELPRPRIVTARPCHAFPRQPVAASKLFLANIQLAVRPIEQPRDGADNRSGGFADRVRFVRELRGTMMMRAHAGTRAELRTGLVGGSKSGRFRPRCSGRPPIATLRPRITGPEMRLFRQFFRAFEETTGSPDRAVRAVLLNYRINDPNHRPELQDQA